MFTLDSGIARDVRVAWRTLIRAPAFAVSLVAMLSLGFALLTTTLAVFNAYVIRSLPYPAADRLYHVVYAPVGMPEPRDLGTIDWHRLADVVEYADSSASTRLFVTVDGSTQEALGVLAAPSTSHAFGIRMAFGRTFAPRDFERSAERVALIDEGLWHDRFGGDSSVIGRTFLAASVSDTAPPSTFRVIGVLAGGYHDARAYARGGVDVVVPMRQHFRTYVVRLRAGVPTRVAERRITDVVRSASASLPDGWPGMKLESLNERYARSVKPVLASVTTAAAFVLILVCANAAVLMLLRAVRRETEIAVRVALGAGALQILRLVAAESAIVCLSALAIALGVSRAALGVLAPILQSVLGEPVPGGAAGLQIDPVVVGIVIACVLASAITLSAVPFLVPWRTRLTQGLRRGGRGMTDGDAMRRARSGLVVAQLALSVTLTVGCGLTIRSALALVHTDLGLDARHVARASIALPRRLYPNDSAVTRFNERFVTTLAARQGGRVALSSFPVLLDGSPLRIESEHSSIGSQAANSMGVSPAFFNALGIRVVSGRSFASGDVASSTPVAILSQTLAHRFFPNRSALGARIRIIDTPDEPVNSSPWRSVVGVVSDVRQAYTDDDLADVYVPFLQSASRYTSLYTRTVVASVWVDSVRSIVGGIDPQVIVNPAAPLDVVARRQLARPAFLATMLIVFAGVSAVLALFGVYAVVAYAVHQREREVAIRTALGASAGAVIELFVREVWLLIAVSIVCGGLGAFTMGRILQSQLHGVSALDPATLVFGCIAVGAGALASSWFAARRAGGIDPAIALHDG